MIKSFADLSISENQIVGVEVKQLKTFGDDRGFFREVIRVTDSVFNDRFAQWSHSKMVHNTVKAWHFHHTQYDWWYIGIGVAHVALIDFRQESPTYNKKIEFKLGDPQEDCEALCGVVRIPPGVGHGCKAIRQVAHLFYITSETYNPEDEGRYPYNSPSINHCWGPDDDLIVVDNDKRAFIPPTERRIKAI